MNDLRRIVRTMGVLTRRAEAVTGLGAPQLWTLCVLAMAGPCTLDKLSRRMRLHPATVAGFVEDLERRGLAARRAPTGRNRKLQVTVTERGAYLGCRAPQVPQIILLEGLGRLSAERLREVSSVLRRITRILKAESAPAQLLFSGEINRPRSRRARVSQP